MKTKIVAVLVFLTLVDSVSRSGSESKQSHSRLRKDIPFRKLYILKADGRRLSRVTDSWKASILIGTVICGWSVHLPGKS